jgi:hypothetical protein
MVIPVSVLIHPKASLPACLPRVKLALLVESSFGCPVAGTFSFPSQFLAGWFEVFLCALQMCMYVVMVVVLKNNNNTYPT